MPIRDALARLREGKRAKFDETLEIAVNLETKLPDVPVRGSIEAPNGLNIKRKIVLFSDFKPDGVDYAGGEELIEKFLTKEIKDCDVCIASRKYMPVISTKLGKILGKKRIMPDARFGTVTDDSEQEVLKAVNSFKKGRMNFRANKKVIHAVIGKISMSDEHLEENFTTLIREIKSILPPKVQIGSSYLSATMSQGSLELKVGSI